MTATLLYRISALVLVLFAAGHTLGFLQFKAPTPEGVAVQQAMDNVRFSIGGKTLTYGDFYRGFGLFCTAYLLFNAFWPGTWATWHEIPRKRLERWAGSSLACRWWASVSVGDILFCRQRSSLLCWRS